MTPAKRLTELKREAIVEAAAKEFKTHGFSATSMDCIAATAEVSKRTIYRHFASKEQLFQAITQQLCDRVLHVSEHPYDPRLGIEVQLRRIAEQEIALLISEQFLGMLRMITSEFLSTPSLTRDNFDSIEDSSIGVVKWIKEATADGKLLCSDPVIAGKQFLALIQAFALWPQFYGVKPVPDNQQQADIIDSAVQMFVSRYAVMA
jgi:TetR/AcrR family transcriptional regulator of autoinduction and epiphytic fitness